MTDTPPRICSVSGCDRAVYGRGWCKPHWSRDYQTGSVHEDRPFRVLHQGTPLERFMAQVDRGGPVSPYRGDLGPCWLWTGCLDRDGYGKFSIVHQMLRPHRFAYETFIGPIPEGLEVDHLCRNRACVNVGHMEVVTGRVNTLRGESPSARNARKTHCPKGHAYTEANTYRFPAGNRRCRACYRRADSPDAVAALA